MFDTILIANRGEIACRIIHTARKMGIRCVAVYSDVDKSAMHVDMADVAVAIGGAAAKESYLNSDRIIEVALETRSQAIHPGYGFLSENPDFVFAIEKAGLTFVGPSAHSIQAMGMKDAAKSLMQNSGVPVVPGYHGINQSRPFLQNEAQKIGYPILIKAVAGGGGKGMRRVDAAGDFDDALADAKAEALSAFGNDDVLIEKLIQRPRHIEIQVFGDGERYVHLFERDCSLQRRHQKVIEEAPAPGLTEKMRKAMGAAAVRAAEAIQYHGAGTVEFVVDGKNLRDSSGFWFMEMNTRLQVEHPVTEAITGIDLVEWQLRIAAGERLPASQNEIQISGHAMEARLYAEDVPAGFLPATGNIKHLAFPDCARVDSGVRAGDQISPWYDPMIAKVISHGETRAIALQKTREALRQVEVCDLTTNLRFLGALVENQDFVSGKVHTELIEKSLDKLIKKPVPSVAQIAWAAMLATDLACQLDDNAGFTLWHNLRPSIALRQEVQNYFVELEVNDSSSVDLFLNHTKVEARYLLNRWHLDNKPAPSGMKLCNDVFIFSDFGFTFQIIDPLEQEVAETIDANTIVAPMPGIVKLLRAKSGQRVSEGDCLVVLEAMKMEHRLLSGRDGIVKDAWVREGTQVEAGAPLITLEEMEITE
ncbi:MAG: ATP-grasp domain-containing protein [Aestuariivita sp.]|nr:ATP-grasp domain-containing protein [Aestuariivita sp.]